MLLKNLRPRGGILPKNSGPQGHILLNTDTLEVCDGADKDCDTLVDEVRAPTGASEIEFTIVIPRFVPGWTTDPESTMRDVVRGDPGLLRSSGGNLSTATTTCEVNNTPFAANPMTADPPPEQGYWHLMRRVNCGGAGTCNSLSASQVGSRDPGMGASPGACP